MSTTTTATLSYYEILLEEAATKLNLVLPPINIFVFICGDTKSTSNSTRNTKGFGASLHLQISNTELKFFTTGQE